MDNADNDIYVYNPTNKNEPITTYKIGDNEELIGVYGFYGNEGSSHFNSFGFIVKVKANN